MNLFRNEFEQLIPRDLWSQENISRKEMSMFLFNDENHSLKEIADYLLVEEDFSDERCSPGYQPARRIFAIDVATRQVVQRFESISSVCRTFLINRTGNMHDRSHINNIIAKQFAFQLDGRTVVLSQTEHVRAEINPVYVHSLNLPRLRMHLKTAGHEFVNHQTLVNDIRRNFPNVFNRTASLKSMMQYFELEWGTKRGNFYWLDTVYVRVVSPFGISPAMSIRRMASHLQIGMKNIRDYIDREVFFKYHGSNRRDSFLVFNER